MPDTCLVVSAWPEKHSNHGIAWYTKLTLTETAKQTGQRFIVLAEKGQDDTPRIYQNGKILVLRVFDKTHPSLYPVILTWLAKFPAIRQVAIHSEFGVNAGLSHYILLLPFIALIKLTGRRIVYFAHNVIDDVTFLSGHLDFSDNPVVIDVVNLIIRMHTKITTWLSDQIVVLDESLQQRLKRILSKEEYKKVTCFPMPVVHKQVLYSKTRAKKKLGISEKTKVLLSFGFISSYKGTDWLIDAFSYAMQKGAKNIHLILAGGPAHSLKGRQHYQQFLETIEKKVAKNPHITITGFLPEHEIPLYFQAADLVILPYRGLMGGSGALSHALGYYKPVVLSEPMQETWTNQDLQRAASRSRIRKSLLFFPLSYEGIRHILTILKKPKTLLRLKHFSALLAQSRNVVKLSASTYNQLYQPVVETHASRGLLQTLRLFLAKMAI